MKNFEAASELIKNGENQNLVKLISENPEIVKHKSEQGISLLQFAAYCRNKEAIGILEQYFPQINVFEAASIGSIQKIDHLIKENPDSINSFSPDGFSPLGLAAYFEHVEIVKLLLKNGANPNLPSNNSFKVAPLHSACAVSNYKIAEILIKHGADVNAKQASGVTPLHSAAHNGNTKLVKLLIENGANLNAEMSNGHTPLYLAVEGKFEETTELIKLKGGK